MSMTINCSLQEKIAELNKVALKIEEVTKTDNFTYIKARRDETFACPVHFAFYSHFIVCSGDYGEWVFDCTWDTNKKNLPESMSYLLGKLSRDCKGTWFDAAQLKEDFQRAKESFFDSYDFPDSYGDDAKNAVEELFDDFEGEMQITDAYRIVGLVDHYGEEICDELGINFDCETWNSFYECGEIIHPQLIVNLVMLNQIREMGILVEKEA